MFDNSSDDADKCIFFDADGEIIDSMSHKPSLTRVYDIHGYAAAEIEAVNALAGYAYSAQTEPEMFLDGFRNLASIRVMGFDFSLRDIDEFIDRQIHYVSRKEEAALRELYPELSSENGQTLSGLEGSGAGTVAQLLDF